VALIASVTMARMLPHHFGEMHGHVRAVEPAADAGEVTQVLPAGVELAEDVT
jgi:hypothetical protein